MKMWYEKTHHRNALAYLSQTEDGWNLRFYWRQYISGTLQREVSNIVIYKEYYESQRDALYTLDTLNYVESENQDRRVPTY